MNKQQDQSVTDAPQQPEAEEWKQKYLRALADYQNLEKRTAQRYSDDFRMAAQTLIVRLLPVIDVLYKAQEALKNQGLDLAVKQFEDVLESEHVAKFDVVGKPFDPQTMECIEVVEGKDDIVMEETRAGYRLHDQIIRPAQVKVGKKTKNENVKKEEAVNKSSS